jgi:hypothetical protein
LLVSTLRSDLQEKNPILLASMIGKRLRQRSQAVLIVGSRGLLEHGNSLVHPRPEPLDAPKDPVAMATK